MTSQLGRLRQWAGEVMSSKDSKMFVSDEFKDLEAEIEVRKEGILKLQAASEIYQRSLSKKKQHEVLGNNEKLLSLDALGVVMIVNGEEIGESSPFGASLVKFGRAHCKIATLQEAYAVTFQDTFIASLQRFGDGIKEYEHLRKKLESRRSAYETAFRGAEKLKQSKKEKERMEAEEELDRAKQRFDETAEDIRAHMEAIRDGDALHQRELTAFLDLELNFAQQYLEVLRDIKSDWSHELSPTSPYKRNVPSRSLSHRSSGNARTSIDSYPNGSPDSSDEDSSPRSSSSRRFSFKGDSGGGSKPPSRPTSRLSRKRTGSNATATSEKDKETGPERAPTPRRRSVAGWASSAVESVTNRRKKDKDNFASLDDDEDNGSTGRRSSEWVSSLKKSTSIGSMGRKSPYRSPKVPQQMSKPGSLQEKKLVRARFDYEAKSSNELSFQAGAEIVALNEVLDTWWMGELNGRRGLFLTTYVEPVDPSRSSATLTMPRGELVSSGSRNSPSHGVPAHDSDTQSFDDGYGTSELDEERDLTSRPMEHSPFIEGLSDVHSIASQTTDDEDHLATPHTPKQNPKVLDPLVPKSRSQGTPSPPSSFSESTEGGILLNAGYLGRNASAPMMQARSSTPTKKAPPPPPPRRAVANAPAPPLPERKTNASSGSIRGHSSTVSSVSSLLSMSATGDSGSSGEGYDRSPFESMQDLSAPSQLPGRSGDKTDGFNPFRRG